MVVCGLVLFNFFFCGLLSSLSLKQLRRSRVSDGSFSTRDSNSHDIAEARAKTASVTPYHISMARPAAPAICSFQRFIGGGFAATSLSANSRELGLDPTIPKSEGV